MAAKMGRPTSTPRVNDTRIRMTDEERAMLDYCSDALGMTKADVIRKGIKKVYQEIINKK